MTRPVLAITAFMLLSATASAQQSLTPTVSALPPDAPRTASGWTVTVNGTPGSAPLARGPWLDVQASTGAVAATPGLRVAGRFRVRAGFTPATTTSAAYGLRLGSATSHLDVLLGPREQWSVRRSDGTVLQPWTAMKTSSAGHGLDAEVDGTTLTVRIDGTRVGSFTIVAGSLDGQPGV